MDHAAGEYRPAAGPTAGEDMLLGADAAARRLRLDPPETAELVIEREKGRHNAGLVPAHQQPADVGIGIAVIPAYADDPRRRGSSRQGRRQAGSEKSVDRADAELTCSPETSAL